MKAIERLFDFFDTKGLKHTPVEKELGLTNGYLGKMRDRKGSIGSDILEKIFCKFPDLNPSWLITGKGSMVLDLESKSNNILKERDSFQASSYTDIFVDKLLKKIELQAETIGALRQEVSSLKGGIENLTSEITLKDQRSGSGIDVGDAQPAIVRK